MRHYLRAPRCASLCVYICVYTHTHTHLFAHTHTHTHTHTSARERGGTDTVGLLFCFVLFYLFIIQVRVSVVGPTPLGYNVMVNDVTEGLVYHSDIFDEEPLLPGLGFRV